jgi:hypothetical protein
MSGFELATANGCGRCDTATAGAQMNCVQIDTLEGP